MSAQVCINELCALVICISAKVSIFMNAHEAIDAQVCIKEWCALLLLVILVTKWA